ncbi:hypothetical protein NRB56_17710 [Nocardia sp. RB56]|uniref:DUF8176 domain-containing protein n=2 Tax=Nocardia aurantia TaxID=2585199 RepID=A0A7K0DKH2_9NOCA|nr:hypothetical protein [Nocardia aurantia]
MIPAPKPRPDRRRRMVVGSAAVVGTAAVVGGVVFSLEVRIQQAAPATMASTADLALGGGPGCEPTRSPELVRGNGIGSTGSGPDAILAFQHAYYVDRSGTTARTVTAPDAWVSGAQTIDAGIATVPVGTHHCVQITPQPDGRFDVVVTESRPDHTTRTYRQLVTVGPQDGATVITRIDPGRSTR